MNGNTANRQDGNTPDIGNLHFRLCHVCLYLNESEGDIEDCEKCHHVFKDEALMQFWDDNDTEAFSDQPGYPPGKADAEDEMENDASDTNGNVNGLNARF